jgi:hypothetical protein
MAEVVLGFDTNGFHGRTSSSETRVKGAGPGQLGPEGEKSEKSAKSRFVQENFRLRRAKLRAALFTKKTHPFIAPFGSRTRVGFFCGSALQV